MDYKHMVRGGLFLVLVIVGMFTFAYLKKIEIQNKPLQEKTDVVEDVVDSKYAHIERIDAKHFFDGKTHTVVGEIMMPTPCDLLTWDTRIQESYPETVHISFGVINTADSCAQVLTSQRFKVSFEASEKALIKAELESNEVILNLVPAREGETPEDFELFLKG